MEFSYRAVSALLALAVTASAGGDHAVTVTQWRAQREERLRGPEGWLTASGLHWLREGDNRFGSATDNEIVISQKGVPARAGTLTLKAGKTSLTVAPGVEILIEGKPASSADLIADKTKLKLGALTLLVHASGARLALRVKDPDSALRKGFKGLKWFPVDEKWRVAARWVAYDKPRSVAITNVMGDTADSQSPGEAVFSLGGHEYRLQADSLDEESLSFVFSDLTAGHETYGSARFLDAPPPKDGAAVLDFNEAYNPPCAYNPFTTCPLPPAENRLKVRIEAGEKIYKKH